MIYFTSDTHFGHVNSIKFCNRPYSTVEEMDAGLITNWNSRVSSQDTIFHLGDFSFSNEKKTEEIIQQLNGQKFLIYGNHDNLIKKNLRLQRLFGWCKDYYELKIDVNGVKELIVLCHFPFLTWNKSHYNSTHLHGHCHGNMKYPSTARILDAGVDPQNYFPISINEVFQKLKDIKTIPLDHHA